MSGCQQADPGDPAVLCGATGAVDGRCLAHLNPEQRATYLAALTPGADIDMRGVTFSYELLQQLLTALTRRRRGRPVTGAKAKLGNADFRGAIFTGRVNVNKATFTKDADVRDVNLNFRDVTFDFRGATFTGNVDFRGATFTGLADFREATFAGDVDCSGVTFAMGAVCYKATFTGRVDFSDATFVGGASFGEATFTERADFDKATFPEVPGSGGAIFPGGTDFSHVTFTKGARFAGVTFTVGVMFYGATFSDGVGFDGATFTAHANFDRVTFSYALFRGATFSGRQRSRNMNLTATGFNDVMFSDYADFSHARVPGAVEMRGRVPRLFLEGMEVDGDLVVEVAAETVAATRIRGAGRVTLRVRAAQVDASEAAITGSFTVQGLREPIQGVDESGLPYPAHPGQLAAVTSLRGTDAQHLVLTDVDLSRCLFAGMHRVDQVRLDGWCAFAFDPRGRRQVLAEEHHWRASRAALARTAWRAWRGWTSAPEGVGVVSSKRLEVLYRQLRTALENSKNEPGAADFYYGEMEMRRLSHRDPTYPARGLERLVLTAYWLLSGYGLRASRAVTALLVMIGLATLGFATVGFSHSSTTAYQLLPPAPGRTAIYQQIDIQAPRPGWGTAFYHAIDSSTSLLHTPGAEPLTPYGQAIEIILRLLGPLLLGLAILAVRGRVKR
ncbi:pentapeptide repeat-containing protein [Sphaerisporangium album]|uniref:Pentapeptide repeat-containing protein n=1 Tax=Sphaerisporangium album TaxID=509200 RepID=A0A367FFY2_9ACTN|nr:pentapeptide repeat-containing protein [Sphaerisporangium album]